MTIEHGESQRPWEELGEIIEGEDRGRIHAFLESLPPGETVRAVLRLDGDRQAQLLKTLTPGDAADLIEEIPDAKAASW